MNVVSVQKTSPRQDVSASRQGTDKPVTASPLSQQTNLHQNPSSYDEVPLYLQAVSGRDWPRKLQILMHAYDQYRTDYNDMLGISPNMIRAVKGLYPEYGQFENIPNSGWSHNPPRSLVQQNALSVPDRIAFGSPIGTDETSVMMIKESGANKLAEIHKKDGDIQNNRFERYKTSFNKDLLQQLKNYTHFDELATQKDDVSQLAYTRLKSLFDNLELVLDEEALQAHTGVNLNMDKEKKHFVTNRLLPDPMSPKYKDKGATLWTSDDKELAKTIEKSARFQFLKDNILQTTMAKSDGAEDILNPINEIDEITKDLIQLRKIQLDRATKHLSKDKQEQLKKLFDDFYATSQDQSKKDIYQADLIPDNYEPLVDTSALKEFSNDSDKFIQEHQNDAKRILTKMDMYDQFKNYRKFYDL